MANRFKWLTWLVDNKHWNALLEICKRVCMLIIGLIPFIVNLCRLGAAVYQIFVFRKYNTGCLKYVVNEDFRNQTIISQVKNSWNGQSGIDVILAESETHQLLGLGRVSIFLVEFPWTSYSYFLTDRNWNRKTDRNFISQRNDWSWRFRWLWVRTRKWKVTMHANPLYLPKVYRSMETNCN